jgi:hypothetical protein
MDAVDRKKILSLPRVKDEISSYLNVSLSPLQHDFYPEDGGSLFL